MCHRDPALRFRIFEAVNVSHIWCTVGANVPMNHVTTTTTILGNNIETAPGDAQRPRRRFHESPNSATTFITYASNNNMQPMHLNNGNMTSFLMLLTKSNIPRYDESTDCSNVRG
jgi:hypothetical protein